MGLDTNQKLLADYNDVFADILNVLLFDGKEVIKEEGLTNAKDRSIYKADGKYHEQERDVSKYYGRQEIRIAFFGIEHQNRKDAFMPARVISYDGSVYRAQLNNLKNGRSEKRSRKLYPVITLVLYFGKTHWSQGKNLYDILDIPEDFKPYVNDYRINLVEVAFLELETIEKFRSDFRFVAEYFRNKRLSEEFPKSNIPINHVDEMQKLLGTLASDERLSRLLSSEEIEERKERGITMCDLFERTINIGVEQERANTEEQRKRADDLEKQLSVLKAEKAEMEKRIKELESSQ